MKIFTAVYDWTLKWAEHKFAPRMLALLTFAESVFFPIPPDVLLAPMVLAKPEKAWRLASLTTISSILGGAVGYLLGYMMFEPWIQPLITEFGYQARFDTAITWFNEWGVWVVFIAGFSPIPYKLFTVSAGFLHMAFLPFLLASAIGRGMRFFLVAGLIQWGGEAITHKLRKWIDMIGWTVVALIIIAYLVLK
ncbi:YqaA family protein [Colwellia sp. 4_MG-2023]|jgi:membrane protein YqaA with SNARE-associated domain|uniref:YqaA family protein n=1 Tax=unclassified Colwellia TaxID=196834 RepID=UPI001C09C3E7|nr:MULTISPECIES: YqaA family protein [unclassified Colwellia]MBU2923211.1 DedA family protein [Colwellia sp. C2M11]MDO6486614.1 YqaA family protein [Colwellia sp. 6_MG-2023]MDO6506684.1 YqaA family protein [Colwellia sp. 5_MG-2023]MDO6555510.1 YqaA family protein [Colwellia sp. 4_MG-2023]MDO6651359.1 YqaA family protein [Colwellia sp. 3_MG-2023]